MTTPIVLFHALVLFRPHPRDYRRPGFRPRPRPSDHLKHYRDQTVPYPIGNVHNNYEDTSVLISDHDSDGVDFRTLDVVEGYDDEAEVVDPRKYATANLSTAPADFH